MGGRSNRQRPPRSSPRVRCPMSRRLFSTMRTWVKATLGGVIVLAIALGSLAATGAFFVFRHMETRARGEADAVQEIDSIKARFGLRPPLVEIVDPRQADIRINRPVEASATPVDTVHLLNWKS